MVSENTERLSEVPELKEEAKSGIDYEKEYTVAGYGERLKGDYPYLDEALKDAYPQDKDVKPAAFGHGDKGIEGTTDPDSEGFELS